MGGFEFKMLGFGYYLDQGQYRKALAMLSDYHAKLKRKEGLIKIPEFHNKQEEIDFYLNLQNATTGAFIDEEAPFFVYYEASKNVIEHVVSLADSTTAPLKLKYPLTFMDSINTPQSLVQHLDKISYVGWLAAKFPQTTFHFARNLLDATRPDNAFEKYDLYTFSPEWKQAMLKWMYDFQDSASGMWGPKSRKTKALVMYDLNNTKSIVKNFRDKQGNNRYEKFPLRYSEKLFKTSLEQLSEPYPGEGDLAEIHEWNLRQAKGLSMLLRYLWNDASDEDKKRVEKLITRNIDVCFNNYYVANEGAFSYYPNSKKASPDGITNLIFKEIGAFSYQKQKKLWGTPDKNITDMGEVTLTNFNKSDLEPLWHHANINSLRIYAGKPDYEKLTDGVWAVFYPNDTFVLDVMELVPNILRWTENSSLSMGNWMSMASLKKEYAKWHLKQPLIFKGTWPTRKMDEALKASQTLYCIGFDKLQVPRCCIRYQYDTHTLEASSAKSTKPVSRSIGG